MSLQSWTKALRDGEFRARVEEDILKSLFMVLSKLHEEIRVWSKRGQSAESVSLGLQLTAECFRSQRNACVQCTRNQCILRDIGFIRVSVEILSELIKFIPWTSQSPVDTLRCGIQFLGNVAVGNQLCKDDIWQHSFPLLFLDLLGLSDEKAVAYACMVLHTCLDEHKTEQLAKDEQHLKVALKVMDLCKTLPEVDWTVLIATQHFFKSPELIEKMYSEMRDPERVTLLELISAQLGEGKEDTDECLFPISGAQFLASCFQQQCKAILSLASGSSSDEEVLVVVRLLDILCEMTSDQRKYMVLQGHPDLLKTTVELLKEVHFLGKESKNAFTVAQDFSSVGPGGATSSHAPVSFKAHLIRLIGNLCHCHRENQNKVRDLDGIALILDNCNIDSNNPFISQWAVFAIRNILEQNPDNQLIVQGLKRQGVADDSVLREMGFRVEERDGSLLLKPIKKDP
ncbi:ataxin-10 [Chanos chanos]|uniref:Ataxin-10 n=1 Tax=Chanos chanos TaxID=29144 RepID=A0A6J2WIT8_CHACN|nr:ataxin-10 [Chanos chanos]